MADMQYSLNPPTQVWVTHLACFPRAATLGLLLGWWGENVQYDAQQGVLSCPQWMPAPSGMSADSCIEPLLVTNLR